MMFGPMVAPLRRVLVRPPGDVSRWAEYGWRAAPDPVRIAEEHEALRHILAAAGTEVVVAEPDDANPDAVYVYDPALVVDGRAVLLRPGKVGRRAEPEALGGALADAGIELAARLEEPALVEGGDTLWLDERTLAVGLGYRTNEAGAEALRRALPQLEVIAYDLPHWHGREEILHLMSLISPLAEDLAVVYPPLIPTRLMERLDEVELVEVPEEEFDSMGCNVLALGPRRALVLEGNPETRRRLEAAGVDVTAYRGEELSRKGDGGPTCLTRPLERG
jgi:dimethylargininase